MSNTCPACGAASSGKFCSECGSSLSASVMCRQCSNEIPPGGRFCNMCGTPVSSASRPGGAAPETAPTGAGTTRLLAAGAAGLALVAVLFVVVPRLGQTEPQPPVSTAPVNAPFAGGGGPVGDPSSVDLSSITPEDAAFRLFERVMMAVSEGDSAQARDFAPMAISAYGMISNLDLDGYYHVALLHLVNNDPPGALGTAETMIALVPTHLFGLYTAGQAEQALGDVESSRSYYERFLASYDAEMAAGRPEYTEHAAVLPPMRENALNAVGRDP